MDIISHRFVIDKFQNSLKIKNRSIYSLYLTAKKENQESFEYKLPIFIKKTNDKLIYTINVTVDSRFIFSKPIIVEYLVNSKIARIINTTYDFINKGITYDLKLEPSTLLQILEIA